SRRRHTRLQGDWSSDVCSSDLQKSPQQIQKQARELKKRLDNEGVIPEMVAPRLWFSPMTVDGAYTSNDAKCRQYAIDRSLRCIRSEERRVGKECRSRGSGCQKR